MGFRRLFSNQISADFQINIRLYAEQVSTRLMHNMLKWFNWSKKQFWVKYASEKTSSLSMLCPDFNYWHFLDYSASCTPFSWEVFEKSFLLSLRHQNTYVNQLLSKQTMAHEAHFYFFFGYIRKPYESYKIISFKYEIKNIYRLNIFQISSFPIVFIIMNLLEKSPFIK